MAETSGFFGAELDETTNQYDREYYAEQFAQYFALFIGNGVFSNPTNQLKVVAMTTSLGVILKEGWAFINGMWYHNDADKELLFTGNYSSTNRIDSVKVRYDILNRKILGLYFENTVEVSRNSTFYDLKVAEINIPPNTNLLTDANITDTRSNEDVCGFVTGIIDITPTKDLFAQYNAIFNNWFKDIQNQLSGDVAGNLQSQIGSLTLLETTAKDNLVFAVNEVLEKTGFKTTPMQLGSDLNSYTQEGFYSYNYGTGPSAVHKPSTMENFVLIVLNIATISSLVMSIQIACGRNEDGKTAMYQRMYFGNVWGNWYKIISTGDTIDNLTSTSTILPLSGNQGRILKQSIDVINTMLTSYKNIIFATEEPTSVAADTIVFVYEE